MSQNEEIALSFAGHLGTSVFWLGRVMFEILKMMQSSVNCSALSMGICALNFKFKPDWSL